jgi:hypothetical protein
MRNHVLFILIATVAFGLGAQETQPAADQGIHLDVSAGGGYSTDTNVDPAERPFDRLSAGFSFANGFFSTGASFIMTNDGKYNSSEPWMHAVGDQYFLLDQGYIRFFYEGFSFAGGYLRNLAPFDDPYELFLNPNGNRSRGMDLVYQTDSFYYESRWIGINYLSALSYGYGSGAYSATPWIDKGMNYRVIGIKAGDFFFGLEDSVVYLYRNFDALYFLSPMPSILTRSILATGSANPWDTISNADHSLMGLFGQYKADPFYAFARILVNDLNLNFIFGDSSSVSSPNVNKLAWSLGGRVKTAVGTFGLFHAGATDYTYAASYPDPVDFNTRPFEYTYYPVVSVNGSTMIDIGDNYIGFQYGENALAFLGTFDTVLFRDSPAAFSLSSGLEFVINGSKSPDKPLHAYAAYADIPQKIQIFANDPVLEYILVARARLSKELPPFTLNAEIDVGYDWNKLGIGPINDALAAQNAPLEYVPMAGADAVILTLTIGASVHL